MRIRGRWVSILAVFKRESSDALAVLRLQAAANDLGTLLRMTDARLGNETEKVGSYRYALRMAAVHIHAIRRIVKNDLPGLSERYLRGSSFEPLREKVSTAIDAFTQGRLPQVIGSARNFFGAHYDPNSFRQALALLSRGALMELPGVGVHFNVCDVLFDQLLARDACAAYETKDVDKAVGRALRDVLDLQMTLVEVSNGLVMALYADAEGLL